MEPAPRVSLFLLLDMPSGQFVSLAADRRILLPRFRIPRVHLPILLRHLVVNDVTNANTRGAESLAHGPLIRTCLFVNSPPKGLTYSRPQLARKTARRTSQEGPSRPKDQYEAFADRLGALADRDGRKIGAPSKVEQFTVCALRWFGTHKLSLGTGTYGAEMESCLRRKARSERDRLWHGKLKIPIANRVAEASSSGAFGNIASEGTDEVTITLADCVAMDSTRYRAHRRDGE